MSPELAQACRAYAIALADAEPPISETVAVAAATILAVDDDGSASGPPLAS